METEKKKIIFRAPVGLVLHPYALELALAVNKSSAVYFLSRARARRT